MATDILSDEEIRRRLFDKYLSKFVYTYNNVGCWIPEKHSTKSRYIPIKFAGFCKLHRLMFYYYNGMIFFSPSDWRNINKGKVIMHSCDNQYCVNPEHLSIGTQIDNIKDRVIKGRSAYYENNGNSALTQKDVDFIRFYYGKRTIRQISDFFNVDRTTIQRIAKNKNWMGLPEHPKQ